ncbi:MAG: phosphomannomutase/phosphoglucomutase [Clostridia bacterium]|nr:phosphomannomutase/phosphoglucomutase [Clostridia bacterium]
MADQKWMKLMSGSDVRGVALGDSPALTEEIAGCLGMSFARYTAEKCDKPVEQVTIALGRDSRVTGEKLLSAAADGIRRAGASVLDFGLCTTPAMYMSLITPPYEIDGSVMITASHLPPERNGLKFFLEEGGLEAAEVRKILMEASSLRLKDGPVKGSLTKEPFLPAYMNLLADRVRKGLGTDAEQPLQGLHVVVDAGNGAGGFYAKLMESLGADTSGSQFLEPDGMFPNHMPNPENAEAMASIQGAVIRSGADLGVIFDADCDRAAIVDDCGQSINRNRLIALVSAMLLEAEPGATIVTDSVTSSGLREFIEGHGGKHYRFKRGYRNVIDEAVRLNQEGISCPLAIETSGHAALKENHFLDDGMYLVTVLIVQAMKLKAQGSSLGKMIQDLREPVESMEIRLGLTEEDFRASGEKIIEHVLQSAQAQSSWHIAPDNREGVRISFDLDGGKENGWLLLRLSVHDPVLPLNIESDVKGGAREMARRLLEVLRDLPGVQLDALRQAAE